MKPKTKEGGSAFGVAVEAGSNELKEAELRDAEAEFKNFMEGPASDPESKAGIDASIEALFEEIKEKCKDDKECKVEYDKLFGESAKAKKASSKK